MDWRSNGKIQKINLKLKKTINTISKLSKLSEKNKDTELYKTYGELLLANLYQKKDFQSKFFII